MSHEQIEVEMVHGGEKTSVTLEEITRIIEPRVAELLMMVQKEIDQYHLEHLMPAGIVFTGGGALLQGIKESTQMALTDSARIGNPHVPLYLRIALRNPCMLPDTDCFCTH